MTGLEMIAKKVRTNREHKGYTAAHDDTHDKGELCAAATCYLDRGWLQIQQKSPREEPNKPPFIWPFEREAWKPSDDPIRNLVHAGALIVAEINRLQRAADYKTCSNCDGSGKVHSHNDICWICDGRGVVLKCSGTHAGPRCADPECWNQ